MYPGLEKLQSGRPRQVDSHYGRVTVSFSSAWWERIRHVFCQRDHYKKQPCPGLYDLSSAKKLKATCPMGKLEFKVFSNRGIPVVIAYFTVTFCKFICTLHFSFLFPHFSFPSDKKYEAVVLPIFGVATPFHISTIKVGVYLFAFVLILRIWL